MIERSLRLNRLLRLVTFGLLAVLLIAPLSGCDTKSTPSLDEAKAYFSKDFPPVNYGVAMNRPGFTGDSTV